MTTKCNQCQAESPEESKFCGECGSRLFPPGEVVFSKTMTLETGTRVLSKGKIFADKYEISGEIGRGGMGVVYQAEDIKLKRTVALKFLPPELSVYPEAKERFIREAQAAAGLSHPNICTIHEVGEADGQPYIAMEYVAGQSLRQRTAKGPLDTDTVVDIAVQVASGLEAAHQRGIIHRDVKSANIMVTEKGQAKIMDFGLAKVAGESRLTKETRTIGTIAYMSPEQAQGENLDQRTDIWSFGVVLYEMLTGQMPFRGDRESIVLHSIVGSEPKPLRQLKADIPAELQKIIDRALKKKREDRYASASEMAADLNKFLEARRAEEAGFFNLRSLLKRLRNPLVAVPAALILIALAFLAFWFFNRQAKIRWVREQAIPEMSRLLDSGEARAAFRLMRRAEAVLPNDPTLKHIYHNSTFETSFSTDPPGAEVWATGYAPDDNDWLYLGTTPFTTKELLTGVYRFRIVKPGYLTILGSGEVRGGNSLRFELDAEGATPPEMVRIPGGIVGLSGLDAVELKPFLIDRYEITNRQFKEFIDRGGYEKPEYWKPDFVQSGRRLSWEEAMRVFRDATGRPGPATWEIGEYPQGRDEYPVNGVSWYEAAAYAEFAGKQLPTIYHWQKAANPGYFVDIAEVSNVNGAGPATVGAYKGISTYGTLDMSGNVKEWCWNEIAGRRYILGGAWNEPAYMFTALEARLPWDRSAQNGIRCVRYDVREESGLQEPVAKPIRDVSKEKPVSDEVFRLFQSLYAYDPTDLDARVEGIDGENSYWKREKVSFAAAYGNERVLGYLYLPKRATPPYQTILYAAPGMSERLPSPQPAEERMFDFIVKSGRAFLLPVLKGMYQRRYAAPEAGPNEGRDRLILESKDFRRSIDYLVSRPDVDRDRLGVYGASRGSVLPVIAVGEQRLKAAVLVSVGLGFDPSILPECNPFNFLPRFRVPTLMICGRSDFFLPVETSQLPMLRLLGAPDKDKKLVPLDGGHFPSSLQPVIKETLDWFDRYLGPVK